MNLLDTYKETLSLQDPDVYQDINQFIEYRKDIRDGIFIPDATDDVSLRNFLTQQHIQGTNPLILKRIATSLEGFYKWLSNVGYIKENPFATYDFMEPMLKSASFQHRKDIFPGNPEKREIAFLRAINRLAEMTNSALDVESMINVTLDTLLGVMTLKTAWVSLLAESGYYKKSFDPPPPHGFVLAAARNLPPSLEEGDRRFLRNPPECHCQKLLRSGRFNRAFNVVECDRLREATKAGGDTDGLKFHAGVPIYSGDRPVGIMNFATEDWQLLTSTDLQLLSTGGELLRSSLQRAHLYDISEEHRTHIQKELELALKVQTSLLPEKLPGIKGYNLAAFWKPALEIAGDFYGVFKLPNRRWGFVIADVSGKGASAAMYMAMTHSLLRERVAKDSNPSDLLANLNLSLCKQFSDNAFVTAFYAILDPARNILTYANAGHNIPFFRKQNGHVEQLAHGGMAMGILPGSQYEDHRINFEPGDSLVMYTDGVTDALNLDGTMFDLSRLEASIRSAHGNATELVDSLKREVDSWENETAQNDDITILVISKEEAARETIQSLR